VELPKVKLRTNAENFRQRRVGGRRYTVDVTSADVDTALADVAVRKSLSRSSSTLNKPIHDDMKVRTLPKFSTKESIMEEDESEKPKGPEFIVNSTREIKTIDISDSKVKFVEL
jgi:hypothetical protein